MVAFIRAAQRIEPFFKRALTRAIQESAAAQALNALTHLPQKS